MRELDAGAVAHARRVPGLAVGLAALDIFSVVAYAAARRTREIGIRIVFGAGGST